DSLNFKKDKEFVGITVLFLDEKLQARLQSGKFKWNDIPTTETASVMDSSLPSIALTMSIVFGFLRFWDSLNFKKDKEFVGITVLFLDEKLQARLQSCKFKWNDIPTTETASVMDSSLPKIALTMLLTIISHLPICFLCGISELISPFQAEQQMEANFSGSSSTSRQIRR
ncbi:hypothetical protein HID58_075804, partial [Brassica napus]